jgi:beta-glucosidase
MYQSNISRIGTIGLIALSWVTALLGCSDTSISFSDQGSLSHSSGEGSFRFGAATAAVQIEDGLYHSDWHHWSKPQSEGGKGQGHDFVGEAVMGYTNAINDISLLTELGLDAYRFSVDWSRIEPLRDSINEDGMDHYSSFIDQLLTKNITPMVTVHHFSSPIWVDNFLNGTCTDTDVPTDENLCGWGHPTGSVAIIEEIAEFAAQLARKFGDRVDDWCTLNEPINYLIASYGAGQFPPGKQYLISDFDRLMTVYRNYLMAHVAIYNAIKANDTIDADGDGVAASVGLSLNSIEWVPAFENAASDRPKDIRARDRIWYLYHHFYPDSLLEGSFDSDLDMVPDEMHPEWTGKLDWLGIQYYSKNGVTASPAMLPGVDATLCVGELDMGACLPPEDETHWIPTMGYEYHEEGLFNVLMDIGTRYENLPLVLTESGLAANEGARRAEHIVRTLEQTELAMQEGIDIRGYYHWSLMDNFEWSEGYLPRFGLYEVDLQTYERTATQGATVYREITNTRSLTIQTRTNYGGTGPMTPDIE